MRLPTPGLLTRAGTRLQAACGNQSSNVCAIVNTQLDLNAKAHVAKRIIARIRLRRDTGNGSSSGSAVGRFNVSHADHVDPVEEAFEELPTFDERPERDGCET